jgi:hypothetical protein
MFHQLDKYIFLAKYLSLDKGLNLKGHEETSIQLPRLQISLK